MHMHKKREGLHPRLTSVSEMGCKAGQMFGQCSGNARKTLQVMHRECLQRESGADVNLYY